jgi:hypothetical protein
MSLKPSLELKLELEQLSVLSASPSAAVIARQGRSSTPSSPKTDPVVELVRPLSGDDLQRHLLAKEYGFGETANYPQDGLKALRDRHMEVARLLVAGLRDKDVAAITDYTPQTITMLRQSPAFLALLAELHSGRDKDAMQLAFRVKTLAAKGIGRLEGLMDDESFDDYPFIASVTQDALNRAGHGGITKSQNLSITAPASAAELRKIRQEILRNERVIVENEAQAPGSTTSRAAPSGGGSEDGRSLEDFSVSASEGTKRIESQRTSISKDSGEQLTLEDLFS